VGHLPPSGKKGGLTPTVRTAEQPAQTLNIDLCLVPATHTLEQKLPAVSCSSGRLVAERPPAEKAEPSYPGQVFADPDCPYEQAMHAFVAASTAPALASEDASSQGAAPNAAETCRAAKRALRQQARELLAQRRTQRAQRRQQDAAWRSLRYERRAERLARQHPTSQPQASGTRQAQQQQWRALLAQRRTQLKQRKLEDAHWRAQREQIRAQLGQQPLVSAWIAILVITDNCTRQCLGIPLFVAGAKVTAEMVVAALRHLLPAELQFLISDRGVHFTAQVFEQLAREEQFLHVVIARHRPQSNGIAERFVRTLKEWLADKAWTSDQELARLLSQFRTEYNARPHQGIAIPGLSPNEFAERIWLF
jgi:transposase InsO family protein